MSCEAHRGKYFQHLAENVPGVDAQDLEKLYQNATNRPNEAMVEVVELKTRMLFNDMQQVGLKPPTHSPTGLPKKKSQHGYAAVYDFLKQKGRFDPKKKKRQEENEEAKSGAKNGPMPPQKFKAAVAEHLREQRETANGHATTAPVKNGEEKASEKAENASSARAEAVATEAKPALSLVGMEEEDNREHAERFPVWKHVPRCGKCGRWLSTQNPVCQNPKCGRRGEAQGEPVAWPPAGANFKHSRLQTHMPQSTEADREAVKQRIMDDARAKHALAGDGEGGRAPQKPPAPERPSEEPALRPNEILIETPRGLKQVEIHSIDGDEIDYEEVLPGRIPIRGAGRVKRAQVRAWGHPAMAELQDYLEGVTPLPSLSEVQTPGQTGQGFQITSSPEGAMTVESQGLPSVQIQRIDNGLYVAEYRPDPSSHPLTSRQMATPEALIPWAKNTLNIYKLAQAQAQQGVTGKTTENEPEKPETEHDPAPQPPEAQAASAQDLDEETAQHNREKTAILQRNGLMEQEGKVVGDPSNPEAALAFSAKLRDAARKADQQADIAPASKVKRLRESARAGYADAERIESTLARCEKCGAFLDKNGECNNPNCPTQSDEAEDETRRISPEDEEALIRAAIAQDIAGMASAFQQDGGTASVIGADDEMRAQIEAEVAQEKRIRAKAGYMERWLREHPGGTEEDAARAFEDDMDAYENDVAFRTRVTHLAHLVNEYLQDHPDAGEDELAEFAHKMDEELKRESTRPAPDAPETGEFGRCEKCGAFLDKNGQCNNPKCPTNTGEPETDEIELEEEEEIFEEPALAVPQGPDYHITEADELGKGGAKTKARQNIEAIKLIQKLDEEGRKATPEEQAILVKFVGWGGLPQMFDSRNEYWRPNSYYGGQKPEFYDEYHELKKLLTEAEWRAASRSTVNAHYTSATVVRGVWDALKHMGYDRADGNVLEPAVGSGNFFGVMPEEFQGSNKVGVELDAFTARIARHLYQKADVRNMGFEKTNLPNDFFDLAISNVPFGNFPVVDREFQGTRRFLTRSIHNFFFAKALDKVKPGGTVAFISSRYTLDSKDDSIRKYLAEKADLVGAIRLPNTAFKENAGTEVTTDIIFLRKRLPGEEPGDTSWVNTQTVDVGSDQAPINRYFAQHPEMMLGTLSMEGSMYSGRELTLQGDGRPIGEALQDAITHLPKGALAAAHGRCQACGAFLDQNGQCNNPRCPKTRPVETRRVLPEEGMTEGQYLVRPEGVYRLEAGQLVPHEKNGQKTADNKEAMEVRRIRGLVALNQAARAVLKLNLEEAEEIALATAQATLNAEYDAFAQAHGPVNSKANQRALSGDPNLPFLMALENDYDAEKNTARKEAIFSKRVISVNKTVEKADTPQDALRVALNETGMVNWERMAELTGLSVARLQKALLAEGYVYQTPNGAWETAEEYLSGNVREKLREAEAAAALNPAYQRNVEALKAVIPRDLDATEIKAPLGSPWIPTEDIAAFAKAMLRADFSVSFVAALAEWKVTPESKNRWLGYDKSSALASQTWGTRDVDALSLLQDALNGKEPTVYKTVQGEDGGEKRVVNQEATIAAREMQSKIKEAFEKWLFTSDDERTARLVTHYNETYNAEVPRTFDGSHLTLPGMGANMPELRAHQKDAIWRISQGQNTLLAHIVGAGKTFSMIGGSMELRRTGLRKKPMHAIPNHMLEQYTADFLRMYPGAKVLAISADDMSEKKRALTMSRIATGDWDAVVVTHSALNKLPVKAESEIEFANEQIEGLREALEAARQEGEKMTVKELEKKLAREEAKLQEKLMKARDRQDNTITFDELGVDQLFVDEADLFKNLDFPTRRTRLAGVQGQASSRAQDLFMKIRVMRKKYGDDQSVVFATGTPIANSVSEMYNMQRFLDYDHLKGLNLAHFDNWASQFGDVVTSIEMKPSGGGYQTKSRFAQFNNVPELKRLFMRFADVQVDPEALNLKRPKLEEDEKGHRRQRGIAAPASDELKSYIQSLVERAENLSQVDPKEDNMLKITSDGRKAALDMRLIDPYAEDNPNSKLNQAVENAFNIYQKTTGVEVPGVEGKQNMAQMIFCDLGTPNNEGFNAYADIKRKLVARGVKPDEIAFMQDHKSDEAKAELFAKVNAGQVRVLIGSTETMGAGTNAQRRMAALHHLDAPWRPRDVEQREGRIIRQGNMNEEVGVYRYLTEESFDVYNWQLLERKSRFIAQVMNRDLSERSVEDIDAKALTYAEMKALATGNPAVIEKVAVDAELRKFKALETSYKQRTSDQRVKLERLPRQIADHQEKIRKATAAREATQHALEAETLREAQLKTEVEEARGWAKQMADAAKELGTSEAQARADTAKLAAQGKADRFKRNGAFSMTVRGRQLDEKDDAAKHLAALESDLMHTPSPLGEVEEVGEYLGFPLLAQAPKVLGGEVKFFLKLTDEEAQYIPAHQDTRRTFGGEGRDLTRLGMALNAPAKRIMESQTELSALEKDYAEVKASAGAGFEHQARLEALLKREQELTGLLKAIGEDKQAVAE